MFNWLMMFWFMLRLLFCWFTKFRLLSFWLLLLLFRLFAMLATVLQIFGLVRLRNRGNLKREPHAEGL